MHKKIDTISGFLMITAMLIATILANCSNCYSSLINYQIPLSTLSISIKAFVKDILMIVFFLFVGIELKLEFHDGFLSKKRHWVLPLIAAIGGMIIPILIYMLININHPENYAGFAIPCATDIAFALCLVNLLKHKLHSYIRIFLLSIAIFDDLGAIFIISTFYTNSFSLPWFLLSIPILGLLWFISSKKVTNNFIYIILGILLSFLFHKFGFHTTLAGFVIGFSLPIKNRSGKNHLKILMNKLHPVVQLFILPAFVFVSSGITSSNNFTADLLDPIVMGIALGLFFGKQIGITLFTFITTRLKLEQLPKSVNFLHVYCVSVFACIGFTMSLFIGQLAFQSDHLQDLVTTGVSAALIICVIFVWILNKLKLIKI